MSEKETKKKEAKEAKAQPEKKALKWLKNTIHRGRIYPAGAKVEVDDAAELARLKEEGQIG